MSHSVWFMVDFGQFLFTLAFYLARRSAHSDGMRIKMMEKTQKVFDFNFSVTAAAAVAHRRGIARLGLCSFRTAQQPHIRICYSMTVILLAICVRGFFRFSFLFRFSTHFYNIFRFFPIYSDKFRLIVCNSQPNWTALKRICEWDVCLIISKWKL